MLEGAEISNNKGLGIKVNNGALLTMEGGKISGNTGTGVEVKGKTDKKGATFIMNGGEISGNGSYGISYAMQENLLWSSTAERFLKMGAERRSQ